MARKEQIRQVGDLRIAIAATLKREDGTVVDLSALGVEFRMCDPLGVVKVAQTAIGVTVTSATDGEVQYSPIAADVDTVGLYHAYFVVIDATKEDTFPSRMGDLRIRIDGCA
jgi:hypothetical protein